MKFIQIVHKYPPYIAYFEEKYKIQELNPDFKTLQNLLINDGFYGPHILKPIFDDTPDSFYVMWDYERLQHTWAKENNVDTTELLEILTAQISSFDPDVIYNMSPQKIVFSFFDAFADKKLVCWNADPYSINDKNLVKYDALLTSSVNKAKERDNIFLHYPSTDPLMNFADESQDIDVFFYGQYNGAPFAERRRYTEELIRFFNKKDISFNFALMYRESKAVGFNVPIIRRFTFAHKTVPSKKLSLQFSKPLFGKDIYQNIARSKIVFNISAEHENFGDFKFNMRIFETLGVGGFMISDRGVYPPNLEDGKDFVSYTNIDDLKAKIIYYLANEKERQQISENGYHTVNAYYSKDKQWENFNKIIKELKNETPPPPIR